MTDLDISEADIVQDFQHAPDARKSGKKIKRLLDGHSENVGDGFSLELYLQCFHIVTAPVTGFALDGDIGKEVHLDLLDSAPLTRFAASSFGIETESPDIVPAPLCLERAREHFANRGEYPRVRGNIGVWRPSDRGLVDNDGFVSLFRSLDGLYLSDGNGISHAEFIGEMVGEYIHNER